MSLIFVVSLSIIAVMTALKTTGQQRQFCYLWVSVFIAWAAIHYLKTYVVESYTLSDLLHSNIFFAYYLVCAALNLALLYFLHLNPDCDYKLIALPIAFYAILSLCVPIENLLTQSGYAYRLFVDAAPIANITEIILLMGADHGLRRYTRRFAARSFALRSVQRANLPLSPGT